MQNIGANDLFVTGLSLIGVAMWTFIDVSLFPLALTAAIIASVMYIACR